MGSCSSKISLTEDWFVQLSVQMADDASDKRGISIELLRTSADRHLLDKESKAKLDLLIKKFVNISGDIIESEKGDNGPSS